MMMAKRMGVYVNLTEAFKLTRAQANDKTPPPSRPFPVVGLVLGLYKPYPVPLRLPPNLNW